ncbi:Serine/threonine-protein kinase smg1 [Podila clonocystis]|nr:Serine/threonine-protein kinase smg1 [Podila clonocystis]
MAQMVHAPAFTPASFTADDSQGLRQDKGNRPTYDAQTVAHMLDSIESVLDNAEECTGLLPSLDQLSALAGMHPTTWKPKFKGIVDLLVGWHVDQGTSPVVRKRIGDVLSMFSKQWPDATEFGQDLLDFFIKDIEGAMVDPKITDKSKIGSVSSLMSCFNIIARALIAHASQGLNRLESIQSRAMTMLMDIGQLGRTPKTVGVPDSITNDIILTLSQGNTSRMYTLQPDAIKVLLRQFENPTKSNSAWKEAMAFTKKILTMWRPLLHPMVTREVVEPTSALMRARWAMTSQSRLMQEILDVILLTIPESPFNDAEELLVAASCPWEGIASEIEDILQILPYSSDLSAKVDFQAVVQDIAPEQDQDPCNGHNETLIQKAESSSLSTQLSNLTFDIMVLVGLSRTQHLDADVMFRRLLKSLPLIPDARLAIFLHALKEVSASRSHFVPDYFSLAPLDDIDQGTLLDSTLGLIFKLIRAYVSHWKALPNASKLCLLAWGADIFQSVQPHREYSGTKSWTILRYSLSSNLHQLIAIAGADEDEMIRGVIASVFEQFIGAFGSMSLGPCLMAKMTDSVLSAFGSTSPSDDKLADNDNRSFQDGDALQRLFHACQGKDILAKLNSESSVVCEEWFSRIRSRVIEGAKLAGEFEIVIRQSFMYRYEHSAKESIALMESYMDLNSDSEVDPQAEFLCQGISQSLSGLCSYQQLQTFMDSIPVDTYTDQTMLWSDDTMAQSLKEYCADDPGKSWRHLEDFYTKGDSHTSQDMLTFDHTNLYGQNFLFVSKVYQQAGAQPTELDILRQRAFDIIQPSAEFLLNCGMECARSAYIDSMMLNTPVSVTPMAVKEFMDFLSEVPEELKMNLLHKDVHQWVRLDGMVNLAKTQTTKSDNQFIKQANGFKFLLSKIARRSECHEFASNIPRTWEGTLSPEIRFEEAKAAMAKHDYTTALRASSKILQEFEHGSIVLEDAESTAAFQSKILLKLAKWSRSTKPAFSAENLGTFEDILDLDHEAQQHSSQARIEAITSGCLQKAVDLGAHYRKTWFAFGTHHYKQGWGILDDLGSFRLHHPVAKAANESLRGILEAAGVDHAENHSKNIFCVFVKHCASGQPFDENTTYDSIRSHISSKLPNLLDPDKTTEAIIESFQVLLERILDSYKLAINGYFRFLQFATLEYRCNQPRPKKITGEESTEEISQSAISDEITATLRLLRLLAKHGGQLYEAFHENLADINVGPWTNIIPQLFARLDHPEKPVQSLIANLLCKIGEQSPQLIVFHCVVGANSAHNSAIQRDMLLHIGEFLTKSHPELVSQVQHLIRELERITVLWEEVWCKKIITVIPELKTTLQELTDQYQGLESIAGLGIEDKDAVMSDNYQQSVIPILATLESLQESNANPETKHEKWFVSTYGAKIRSALNALRAPKAWNNLFEGLGLLKEICTDLNKELSGTRILQLSDLSPELSSIQSSLIDIPSHISGITIQSFEQQVVVIPTKTKPKKLTLVGSDGKRYTYLFKGLEDLHLDERVMQLLRISNGMLQRDKESNSRHLSARHYAVVPLSDSSGMIQWVESTVSLYTIIAKWQHRELVCARWMTDDTSTAPQGPQRATDIYHEKAAAALKKAGLPANHPRRQWPKSILLDVYHDMASETPADLLEREIWASSPTPAEWWRKSFMFARSTAVMSMIGYVIGLGDRHLDNILIDFTTGDLVHIDYNVCFEKGKRLRIPEVVPFRLTRNILTSFGVTGVEGNFRVGCEQTMKVMRKNKEILVTLLEAFVYDPLVDWQIEAPTNITTTTATLTGQAGQGRVAQVCGAVLENESEASTSSSRSLTSSRRRLSNDSIMSTSSVSIRSTTSTAATTVGADSSKSLRSVDNDFFSTNQQPHQQQQPHHQRNAYAVNILRRVRHKLEGRDFDSVNKFKVSEQVDRVIQEATNVENLANMYEGWTSWI